MDNAQIDTLRNVTVVSDPDDVLFPAKRLLLVNLTSQQTGLISDLLLTNESQDPVIIYTWSSGQSVPWLLDKKLKSHTIIFNADCEDLLAVGILATDHRSYYFGTLFDYEAICPNRIIDIEKIRPLL